MFRTHPFALTAAWKQRLFYLTLLCAVLLACWVSMDRASALYILTGEDESAIVLDQNADVESFASQLVYINTGTSGYEITLTPGRSVTVLYDGAQIHTTSRSETVSALLSRLHVIHSPLEMVGVNLNSDTSITLTVASDLTYYDKVTEPVAYETQYVKDPNLAQGTQKVVQAGVNGTRVAVYEVVYSAGELVSRQFVEASDSTAVKEIVHVGTAVSSVSSDDRIAKISTNSDGSGVLTFKSGATMKFKNAKSMTATAYTAGTGGADTCTATGTTVRIGTVAVDPKVIPLGTHMYIVTNDGKVVYGMAVAEDTGVFGSKVDLYYNSYRTCINFGRRAATVYLLG